MRQLLLLTCEIFVTRPDVSGHTHTKNWSLEFKKQAALRSPLKKRAHLKHHHPEII